MDYTDPIARILLLAISDDNCIFSKLQGVICIVEDIWKLTLLYNKEYYKKYIENDIYYKGFSNLNVDIKFPLPKDLNINMMPFIMSKNWNKTKLPDYLKEYYDNIIKKCYYNSEQENKIYFLTIEESLVDEGKSQRRPGLHVECGGKVCICDELTIDEKKQISFDKGNGNWKCKNKHFIHPWGMGLYNWGIVDGIFMCSNISDSCMLWNCRIIPDENDNEVIGHLGDIDHLKSSLPITGQVMKKNKLYWITDRTPHESLPMKTQKYRQFFRLVTENVGIWYEKHSTKNPNGVVPDSNITRIIKRNKFKK